VTDLPPGREGVRADEQTTDRTRGPHNGHDFGRYRVPPAGASAEAGCLGSSLLRGSEGTTERIVAINSQLYAGMPGPASKGAAQATAAEGTDDAPRYQLDAVATCNGHATTVLVPTATTANELRHSIKAQECYCPLANTSYTNMLTHGPTLLKVATARPCPDSALRSQARETAPA
jgi:hypothetical protein